MKALIFQSGVPSILNDKYKNHSLLVFDLTTEQDATENCHYPQIIEEPLRLELNFIFPLKHVTELIVLEERMSWVAVDEFGGCCCKKTFEIDNVSLQQIMKRIRLFRYRYFGSFPSNYVPCLPNATFGIINTQPSKMQGELWEKIANSCDQLFFAHFVGSQKYSSL